MQIINSIMTNNPCYQSWGKIIIQGLMLHSVGCNQPDAQSLIKNWNRPDYTRACVHAIIDGNTGDVYQTLPWDHKGWHAGGSANNTHIGVEMCEPGCIKYTSGSNFTCSDTTLAITIAQRTYRSAVELFAKLCMEYHLRPFSHILSHSEGHALGIATNHADPEHLWIGLGLNYTMDTFRLAVKEAMNQAELEPTTPEAGTNQVYVSINNLAIRKGPGTNYARTGQTTGKGTFTIVEVQPGIGSKKGWGRLKSGAGWISLDYTT